MAVQQNRIGSDIVITKSVKHHNEYDAHKIVNFNLGVINKEHTGRFPTQLFTNIKNEQYKYVKYIT